MKIFISGGTGFVGEHLCRTLRERGHQLRLLVHRRRGADERGIEYVTGDITDLKSCAAEMSGCDAIVNLVGIIREFPGKGTTFERLHVQVTANLLTAAALNGINRYLQMSALGTRAGAVSAYHQTKWRAEESVRKSSMEWTIFRPSLIFGPHDGFINMLAAQLRLTPIMPVIGNGRYRLQPIHVDDVVRCFALALEMPETVRQTYELCGNDRVTYEELLDMIAASLGRSRPFKPHLPLGVMQMIIPLLQKIPLFPITMDQLQMLLEESICDNKWPSMFGFEPRRLQDGIDEYLSIT